MHAWILRLLGLAALAAACGHSIDTSIEPVANDAGVADGSATDGAKSSPDGATDDDDDGGSASDATRDVDSAPNPTVDGGDDKDTGPDATLTCTSFTESFDANFDLHNWSLSSDAMQPQYFARVAGNYGKFQSSTAGTPPTPFLKHSLAGNGCLPTISANFTFYDDNAAPNTVTTTLMRVKLVDDGNLEIRRSGAGVAQYFLGSAGPFTLGTVQAPGKHNIELAVANNHASLRLDGAPPINVALVSPAQATEFAVGFVTMSGTANVTVNLEVADIFVH